jgi:hypothetical protein
MAASVLSPRFAAEFDGLEQGEAAEFCGERPPCEPETGFYFCGVSWRHATSGRRRPETRDEQGLAKPMNVHERQIRDTRRTGRWRFGPSGPVVVRGGVAEPTVEPTTHQYGDVVRGERSGSYPGAQANPEQLFGR